MPKGRGRKDSDSDAASVEQPVVGTFETLRDEGEHFVHVKQYQKAIESFTKALEMHPGDKTCLVTRSKCYLMLGNSQAALTDAEAALDQDEDGKKDIRALCMKAEALYQTGDFETALVYYHRGHKLRPELQDFRLGIQKSQEAINNSIGTPDAVKLEASGDLAYFYKQEEKQKQQQKGYSKPQQQKREEKKERTKPMEPGSAKTTKQLLGELFKDKAYLEKIYDSLTASSTDTDDFIKGRAVDGLEYLNMRADFWRQQKPMYARQRDRKRQKQQNAHSSDEENQPMQYILQKLEEIDEAQSSGKYEQSLKKSQTTLMKVEKWGEDRVQNKHAVVANLYSCIGNAYLEMEKYKEALDFHNKDLYLGREHKLDESESRALDNLGRTNARMGKFDEAIDIWEQKLPKSKSALESTWLYHEIGRCYLELGQFIDAKDYGEKSCAAAKEADDLGWQLHSVVLLAQAEAKCKELQAAADSFERALEIAEKLKDKSAQSAIHVALDEINACIVKGVCEDGEEKDQEEAKDNEKQSDSSPGNRLDDKNKDNSKKADDRHNIMDDDQKDKDAKDKINEDRKEQKDEADTSKQDEILDTNKEQIPGTENQRNDTSNAADNDRRRETEKQAAEEEKENDDIEAQDSNGHTNPNKNADISSVSN